VKVFLLFFVLACGGAIFAYIKLRAGEVLRFETSVSPKQVIMTAIGVVGNKRGWVTLSQGDGGATFSYVRGANGFLKLISIFCILTIVFIVPAIMYLVLAGKKESLSVATDEIDGRMTVVQVTSNGWRGKTAGRGLKAKTGLGSGTVAAGLTPAARY
jgi:preprotein translocase subunit SecG